MSNNPLSYAQTGVNIDETDAVKKRMASDVGRDDARVLNPLGAFGSLVDGRFEGYDYPVLVLKTEEPGSKQKLAFEHGRVRSLAHDLVNHLINDIIVMGADPFYLQNCIVCGKLEPAVVQTLVRGIADACAAQGCALTGGETSVQPGVVEDGVYILSASAIGVVDKDRIIDGAAIEVGDAVLALASNGLHTNGYTLVRALLKRTPELKDREMRGVSFLDAIMRPHLCYYQVVKGLFRDAGLKGMAHITGGGIRDNLSRILPENLNAVIDLSAIQVLPVFKAIRAEGAVAETDMLRTFNLGVGMILVCAQDAVAQILAHLNNAGCRAYPIGHIVKGTKSVAFAGGIRW